MKYFEEQFFPLYHSNSKFIGNTANFPTYYGIQYNHAGKLRLRVDHGVERIVDGPHVFITHPGSFFEYSNVNGEPRHHCFICSCGERIKRYIEGGLLELNLEPPLISIANSERFLLTMLEIMALLRKSTVPPPRAVLLYVDLLLQIRESREERKTLAPYRKDRLEFLAERIRNHPELNYDFTAEARAFHVTVPHFRHIFRQVCGAPPQQYLIHRRLEMAAKLLLTTNLQVAEAAERSGIPNRYYFSKLFREKYRIAPLDYRREFK